MTIHNQQESSLSNSDNKSDNQSCQNPTHGEVILFTAEAPTSLVCNKCRSNKYKAVLITKENYTKVSLIVQLYHQHGTIYLRKDDTQVELDRIFSGDTEFICTCCKRIYNQDEFSIEATGYTREVYRQYVEKATA